MRRRNAFSLIEVLIVLAVLAVLASAATVSYMRKRQRAEYVGMRANVRVLTGNMKSYFYTVNAYDVTANTGQTNNAYGTQLADGNFCRYTVSLVGSVPQVRVQHWTQGCGTGVLTNFRFNISGDQIFCAGPNCMTG